MIACLFVMWSRVKFRFHFVEFFFKSGVLWYLFLSVSSSLSLTPYLLTSLRLCLLSLSFSNPPPPLLSYCAVHIYEINLLIYAKNDKSFPFQDRRQMMHYYPASYRFHPPLLRNFISVADLLIENRK